MIADVDAEFLRDSCRAVGRWGGVDLRGAEVLRLHGKVDPVIVCPRGGVEVIEGAGHLLAMTHAEDCVRLIREWLG